MCGGKGETPIPSSSYSGALTPSPEATWTDLGPEEFWQFLCFVLKIILCTWFLKDFPAQFHGHLSWGTHFLQQEARNAAIKEDQAVSLPTETINLRPEEYRDWSTHPAGSPLLEFPTNMHLGETRGTFKTTRDFRVPGSLGFGCQTGWLQVAHPLALL